MSSSETVAPQSTADADRIRSATRGPVLYWLLMAALTLNLLDRQVINVLGHTISEDLQLTDSQLGLLGGIAFSLVYFVFGFPWGWAADRPRTSRVWLIAAALTSWSAMTALCGLAQTYMQLLLARMGVAAGEAGCGPAAKSLIADCAPRAKLAGALAIFGLGIPIGAFLGKALGGILNDLWGWRSAFLIVGLPGVILAVLLVAVLRDPRGLGLQAQNARPRPRGYGQALREILRSRTIIHGQIAWTLASGLVSGGSFWGLIHFQRNLGLSAGEAGVALGVMGGLAGLTGTLGGGWLADRLARRHARHYFTPALIGMLASPPLLVAAFAADAWWLALFLLILPSGFDNMAYGGANAAEQQLLSPEVR
ncbi:MAG TPA: MFS transporter, partial [Chloroflexia bacterium]|nr:MFS transporter [Chloroflexia bacterium]